MIFFDWTAEELRKQADLEDEKEAATPPDDSVAQIVAWLRDTAAYTQDHGLSRAADMIEKAYWK